MAASQLIAVGATLAASADVTITTTPLTVALNGAAEATPLPSGALVYIQAKDAGNLYWTVGQLTAPTPSAVISGPGVYRLLRPTQKDAVGAFNA